MVQKSLDLHSAHPTIEIILFYFLCILVLIPKFVLGKELEASLMSLLNGVALSIHEHQKVQDLKYEYGS